MQSRDPLVITRAAHNAVFKRERDKRHEIHRGFGSRVHVVGAAVDVEGIVGGG